MICIVLMALLVPMSDAKKCPFEAIFNFGDSNTDTGGFWAAFPAERLPYGMTYFKRPSGRATDGRVIIDFLGNSPQQFSYVFVLKSMIMMDFLPYKSDFRLTRGIWATEGSTDDTFFSLDRRYKFP